jgi:hypothetical protein
MRSSALLLLMLWVVLAPAVPTKAQPTAWMDITVYVSTDTPIYLPVNFTVPYMLQLVDPSSGAINILYPNRMLNISDQQLVTIGSYTVDSITNKITFWTGINVTAAGNYTFNFRLIYDSVLMANNTIDTSLYVYGTFPWMYRVPIMIANNLTSALTNYQIGLYLNLSAQVSAGKIRSDLGDLRFNDSSGNALSYWIEDATASAARIWVKVPSIPASPSTITIYMYYGNPSATSQSNGDNTFLLFDDFLGTSLNTTKWSLVLNSPVVDGGYLKLTYARVRSVATFGTGYAVLIRSKVVTDASDNTWGFVGGGYYIYFRTYSSGYTATYNTAWEQYAWAQDNAENTYQIIRNGSTNVIFQKNYVNVNTHTTQVPTASIPVYFGNDASDEFWVNWVAVRQYVSPEPTYLVGSEQQLINYAYSVSYSQLSTESQLTVQIPAFSPVQTFTANVSGTYTAPTPLPDAIKIIYNMEYGRYALALLPILFMLVAGKHYAGIMGIFACGMSALINVTVGVALFDWTVLGIIAFVCILLIFTEGG